MKRIIDRVEFENALRKEIRDTYIKTSKEELNIVQIMMVFEEVAE